MALLKSLLFLLFLVMVIGVIILAGVVCVRFIDYIEENPYGSKSLIEKIIYIVVGSHILFLFMRLPILHILFSLSISYAYNCLLDSHAEIQTSDPRFLYGIIGSLVSYFLMIRFISIHHTSLLLIIPCFCIIWVVPICFFFSMSATEDTLFKKTKGGSTKTYAGQFVDYIFSLGKKSSELKR